MSQFIDKLMRVSQVVPQPMGFRTAQSASEKPGILLIASLAQTDIDSLADRLAGADAGLLHVAKLSSGAKDLEKALQAVPGIPWGGWLEGVTEEQVEPMTKAVFDFVVFPPASTSLAILDDNKTGKVLQVETSISVSLLPAFNELPVDAILVAGEYKEKRFLTWQHLMFFQRCADLLTKPLLVSVPSNISTNELKVLWEAGVSGVVVGIESEQPPGRLEELRRVVDKLDFTAPRKTRKAEPLLPYTSGKTYIVDVDEGEEEDGEEDE